MSMTSTPPWPANDERFGNDRRLIATGAAVVVATFGIFGTWAALAPLSGAVIVNGAVSVESERKTVQHLEGGIVKRILVKPGSTVAQGEPLIQLEEVAADAAVSAIRAQLDADTARVVRLNAERVLASRLEFPHELMQRAGQGGVAQILDTERTLFATRRRVLDEQIALLRAETGHIRDEVASLDTQVQAGEAGIASAREQLLLNEKLMHDNFVSNARVLDFRGQLSDRQRQRAEAAALAAQARQKIKQNELKIESLRQAYVKDATDELRQAERRVDELRERLRPNQDALTRSTIVAPIAGTVVDLKVHTVGGVIAPREPLLDIVPAGAPLTIKAKARADDITHLRVGAPVSVQLTAYKRRTTPAVDGRISYLSADTLLEPTPAGPVPYYELRIDVERAALQAAGDFDIVPGMPIEAYVQTDARTLLEYLVQPVTQALRRAGREH
jgi:HlyD family type I secretion membrane fusion protein